MSNRLVLAGALLAAGLVAGPGACGRFSVDPPPPVALEQAPRGETLAWEEVPAAPAADRRALRHRSFVSEGIPVEYINRVNPVPPTQESIAAGGQLYAERCAACHDPRGLGYGEYGRDLTLPPAILAVAVEQPSAVDQYLMWAISEGGNRFGSEMPAYKGLLGDREIWSIVTYMRAGFPPVPAGG